MNFLETLEHALRARRSTADVMAVKALGYAPLARVREYLRVYTELMDQYRRHPDSNMLAAIGVWKQFLKAEKIENAIIEGWRILRFDKDLGEADLILCNAFVNQGLQNGLDLWFGLSGSAISHMGLSSDNTATTASSTTFGGTVSIKAISPTASRSSQTVTAGAQWTQADSPGPATFSVRKSGLLKGATDVANVQNIIGGAGTSPYNKPFTLDYTTIGTFTQVMQNQVTLAAI